MVRNIYFFTTWFNISYMFMQFNTLSRLTPYYCKRLFYINLLYHSIRFFLSTCVHSRAEISIKKTFFLFHLFSLAKQCFLFYISCIKWTAMFLNCVLNCVFWLMIRYRISEPSFTLFISALIKETFSAVVN